MEGLTRKLDDMADVSNWQEEVAELDKCIAWCDALRLREEVQQQTAVIEGELPAKVLEVCRPSPYSTSSDHSLPLDIYASGTQSVQTH